MTLVDQICDMRRKARELRRDADRLDAQANTLLATEHARLEREQRLKIAELREMLGNTIGSIVGEDH
jgi:hypothetical protein